MGTYVLHEHMFAVKPTCHQATREPNADASSARRRKAAYRRPRVSAISS
jgi:hypothetical protein